MFVIKEMPFHSWVLFFPFSSPLFDPPPPPSSAGSNDRNTVLGPLSCFSDLLGHTCKMLSICISKAWQEEVNHLMELPYPETVCLGIPVAGGSKQQ